MLDLLYSQVSSWRYVIRVVILTMLFCIGLLSLSGTKPVPPAAAQMAISGYSLVLGGNIPNQQGLAPPDDIACRPFENTTDQVRITWTDTNTNEDSYRIERRVDNGAWSEIGSVGAGQTSYVDSGLNSTSEYRYRIHARDANGNNGPDSDTCRKPLSFDSNNFRVYYRSYPVQDCPPINGKQTCVPDTANANGDNEMAARISGVLEGSRSSMLRVGFDDMAFFDGGKPLPTDLIWCDGGGCAGTDNIGNNRKGGIGLAPAFMGTFNPSSGTGDPSSILITLHELFHQQHYTYGHIRSDPDANWVNEGQARSIQDKFCVSGAPPNCVSLDNVSNGIANYVGEVNNYLGNPNRSIPNLSYTAALFWTYLIEQYGTLNQEPEIGLDILVRFWEQARNNQNDDGIGTLNRTLQDMGYTERFRDVFKDFVVANYAKDLSGSNVPDKYKYVDETQPPGSYKEVKREEFDLGPSDQVGPTTSDVVAWGARYFEVKPTADVPILNIEFRQDTSNDLYYTLLAVKNDDIVQEINHTGENFIYTLINDEYDKVVVIVAGLDNYANFRYTFNGMRPILNILDPIDGSWVDAGDPNAPEKILIKVEVLSNLEAVPVAGIDSEDFVITIGNEVISPDARISNAYVQGQYWMVVRAPGAPAHSPFAWYDLTVSYKSALSDTERSAVYYAPRADSPRADSDNVLIIDRSGSMGQPISKLEAAQDAAKLHVDSWREGDKIGIVSYNQSADIDMNLRDWDDDSRTEAFSQIDDLTPGGNTSLGEALITALGVITNQGNTAHNWALVLLSDGIQTQGRTIDDFLRIYKEIPRKPSVHAVAIGPDANRPELERLVRNGGKYHYASEPFPTASATDISVSNLTPTEFKLELAEIYRVVAETVAHQQQIYSERSTEPSTHTIPVDGGASEAIFVWKWNGVSCLLLDPDDPDGWILYPKVTLLQPDNTPVDPKLEDDVADGGHKMWRIPTPVAGDWTMIVEEECPEPLPGIENYLVEAALKSDLTMDVFLGLAVEKRLIGQPMPILVSLSDNQAITGATVTVRITDPADTIRNMTLYDDGFHSDGEAGDGFYGNIFYQTFREGSYVAVVSAEGSSALAGDFQRRSRVSFNMDHAPDTDGDGIPDPSEEQRGTDPNRPDAQEDPDNDGRTNEEEYRTGTHPLDPDTDDGGQDDGSEATAQTDPFNPNDDMIDQPRARVWAGVGQVWVRFTVESDYDVMRIYRSLDPDQGFVQVDGQVSATGEWIDTNVTDNIQYCYRVAAVGQNNAVSAPSNVTCATPRTDPVPPTGYVLINDGATSTPSVDVDLTLWAQDNPPERESEHPGSPPYPINEAQTSGVAEMMISNDGSFENAPWEPYQTQRSWQLEPENDLATVFVKFRDAAGNESIVSHYTIIIGADGSSNQIWLPLIVKEQGSTQPARSDLVPIQLIVEPDTGVSASTPVTLTVVMQNLGSKPAPANFWVDLYINPLPFPNEAGHIWNSVCPPPPNDIPCADDFGLAWQVTEPVAPGQEIILTSRVDDPYLVQAQTHWPGFFNKDGNQELWVYVDSWNGFGVTAGFVTESNETNNRLGPVNFEVEGTDVDVIPEILTNDPLPFRPIPTRE